LCFIFGEINIIRDGKVSKKIHFMVGVASEEGNFFETPLLTSTPFFSVSMELIRLYFNKIFGSYSREVERW
jgi:hypothetical protein